MKSKDNRPEQAVEPRRQIEEIARRKSSWVTENLNALSPEEVRRALHELQVYQIELEIQNEELGRSREEFEVSQARYFELYDLAPVGYCTLSENGLILEANLTAATLFGMERGALVKQPITRFIRKEDQDSYYRHRKELIETGEPQACELQMVKMDGTAFWGLLATTAARDADGATACRVVISDITERKRAEEALRESEERYRTVADFTYDWEYWLAPDLRFLYCSPSCERITGYRADEFEKDPHLLTTIIHPDDRDQIVHHMDRVTNPNPELYEHEFRILSRSGEIRWIAHVCQIVYGRDGTYLGRRASNRDITERKRAEKERIILEEQYQQAQKMESVGRLAGGVAHDFNNMLGVILGHTEMAMEQIDPTQPLHASLDEIHKAAKRSAVLTRQLLAFARKQTVSPKVLDLNATVEGMLTMLGRLIGENIHLDWRPVSDLWPVRVDPSQIDQILANLCVNSRDSIEGVGKLAIETENVAVNEAYCVDHTGFIPGEYVRLAVSDNGCGMDRGMLAHIFEPFFTTKDIGKGTGLGLAMVYGIVKQNDGFINVSSEPGQGTTFEIYLPRHAGEADQAQAESASKPAVRGREVILLVEDEPSILKLTALILEKQGYTVLAASTPGEAIRMARKHAGEIHLLMTDVVMPEMNGRDLAKNLLILYPRIKRLFMSGYTADIIADHGVLDEGVHFIQKPFARKDLAAKVREALDQK